MIRVKSLSFLPLLVSKPSNPFFRWSKCEQFHFEVANWCWHSCRPSLAPCPTTSIIFGYFRHNDFCSFTKPAILLQPPFDPTVKTWELNLEKIEDIALFCKCHSYGKTSFFPLVAIFCYSSLLGQTEPVDQPKNWRSWRLKWETTYYKEIVTTL